MTEAEWGTSGAPDLMLNVCWFGGSARKKRLFGCACCRHAAHLLNARDWVAVQTAERYADGAASAEELAAGFRSGGTFTYVCTSDSNDVRWVWTSVANRLLETGSKWHVSLAGVSAIIRDIFGNPFRPVSLDSSWLTSDVLALARGIYDERAFDRMPILADALQDAGCDNEDVLNHCRQPGVHVRGCWCVDLVLAKR